MKDTKGSVYLLFAENGLYKIGKTMNLAQRVAVLRQMIPLKIDLIHVIESNDCHWAERMLHERFARSKVQGEWFDLDSEDITYIKNISRLDAPDNWRGSREPKSKWHHDSSTYHDNDSNRVVPLMAKREIACDRCGELIGSGELFSRSSDRAGTKTGIRYAICRRCKPFNPDS